ncbi:MAG: UPF0182 family protein [Chloroflexi bacterium]|nr:UPF0182 family protein [Chloroflexota bacterium]
MFIFSLFDRREDLGPPPPPFRMGGPGQRGGIQGWVVLLGLVLLVMVVGGTAREVYTELLWFESVGYTQAYVTTLVTRAALFGLGALVFFLFFMVNLFIARRVAPAPPVTQLGAEEQRLAGRMVNLTLLGVGLFIAFVFGSVAAGEWSRTLRFLYAVPFGMTDPVFQQDIGFYVFSFPIQRFLQMWGTGALLVTLLGTLVVYGVSLTLQGPGARRRGIRAHVSTLGMGVLLLLAFGYWLDRYDLLYSDTGAVFGPGYTDINVRLPVLTILTVLAAVSGVLLGLNIFGQGIRLPALGIAAWALVGLVGGGMYPEFVQRFQVEPNELARERPYIENNIRFTRQAFGLDRVEEVAYPGEDQPAARDIAANPETIKNIRLWDHEPLKSTYEQIQAIRRYYEFHDVDIDRYRFDGEYRQVMLSARELAPDKLALAGESPTWVNRRLKFTHGYGVALSPVNEISAEGLPTLLVKNLPPVSTPPYPAFEITRPEVYFGEKTGDWVIVNTEENELDFASEVETKYTRYAGKGGVLLDSWFKRAIFAWQMADPNILLTALREESRILYVRQVQARVRHIAPFMTLDRDPYLVIYRGRLLYVQDAYTTTNRYPYAEPYRRQFNYIRNSVKAVVDAYDGTVNFYIADPSDPIIRTYDLIFPGLFKPLEAMPEELQAHMRYPEDLFNTLADMYQIYHMQDPQVFYNKEDAYTRPIEVYLDKEKPMDAYYVIMRMPGQAKAEFILILPFTPVNKNNTNAWLAGRSDAPNYGKLLAFKFPSDRVIYGPRQIESRIDQDPTISPQFSLWNQSGSKVLRGNLLFIPIGESYLYVEPVYLQSERSKLPELKRVVVAAGNRIAMEATLEESLNKIYVPQVTQPPPAAAPAPTPPATPPGEARPPAPLPATPQDIAGLSRLAQEQFTRAQERLRAGDWAGYGQEQQQLEQTLKRLAEMAQR